MAPASHDRCDPFEDSIREWFVDRGVPYFCPDYRGRDRFDDVAVFLFIMLAVEIGVAWLGLSALGLILVLTLVVYAVVIAPLAVPRRWLQAGGRGWLLPGVLLVGAVGVGLSPAVGLPLGRVIDAVIFFAGLYAAFELADSNAWMREGPRLARQRAEVVSLTVIAVIVFALEGSVFRGPFDQTAVALVVVLLILRLARSLASPVQPAPQAVLGGVPEGFSAMAPVMPLLVILFGTETALLPHIADSVLLEATLPLALTALLALASVLAFLRVHRVEPVVVPSTDRVVELGRQVPVKGIRVVGWVLPFLLTYPLLVLLLFELDTFGARLDGVEAALVALGINVLFTFIAWMVVAFGIDDFAQTVRSQAKTIVESIVVALANGLPLLIVFIVFFALTAETWEVAAEATMGAYIGLIGVLLGFTLLFIVAAAAMELRRESRFGDWTAVRDAALREHDPDRSAHPDDPFRTRLEEMGKEVDPESGAECLTLRGKSWLNAISVLTAYQLIVFIPVTIVAALLFWGLGRLAVPPEVAAQWIGGDNVSALEASRITGSEEPWLRVGMLLGAFSSLYLAVTVQSSEGQRKQFFDATERGVKQLLAVKVVYDRFLRRQGRLGGVPAGPHCQR